MITDCRDTLYRSENSSSETLSAESDDKDLVKASKHGDQTAFALLVQRHQHRVYVLSMHMLRNPEEASEATQDAFLAAWQGLSTFRGDALFSSWLYRIAYNCCLRVLNLHKHTYLLQEKLMLEQMQVHREKEQQVTEIIEQYEQRVILQEQMEHLPTTYRMVLHLRYLQDRTYEEIASTLALPLGTIKTSLFRAKRMLRERLVAHYFEGTI